ncbi:Subunit of heteropentameric Replication factor C (RF-C) [Perkinsus olseni]|uniref:Subunit of heteropentameric Replication factor C (RF-C) n=1 Tax=Perkinsus olseni TaxID=32597 RepID=A0A7J6LQ00_PEROL|nr:Subunit of heteropentameric Replication factor C (RF-C) [Perkinsus olseni]KAF4661392.1 Subunit of heteropentameric Replication factor C (RF-C) [Perkinsus olseni]
MSFLVDTERPQKLDELTFHPSLTRTLKKLAASKDCPHLLFYGPSGGGKMIRIRCLLEGMFGPGAEKTSTSFRQFKATTSTTVDIQVVVSAFHVEVTPSDVGIRDAAVIQQLIKQMAENPPVGEVPFHVVVINDAHCLTRQAQAALRRTMEKYVSKIRFIFHADSLSPLIPPLRSRCLGIRVPRPTPDELQRDMMNISQRHALGLNPGLCARIGKKLLAAGNVLEESGCDARLALIRLDVLRRKNVTLSDPRAVIEKQSWKVFVEDIAKDIVTEQSPKRMLAVRAKLYTLLTQWIDPRDIFYHLVLCLGQRMGSSEDKLRNLTQLAARYEGRRAKSAKAVMQLEAFVAQTMMIIINSSGK